MSIKGLSPFSCFTVVLAMAPMKALGMAKVAKAPKTPKVLYWRERRVVYFNSNSAEKGQLYELSNFFKVGGGGLTITWPHKDWVPKFLRLKTCTYPSSEHAYQVLKSLNEESAAAMEVGGKFWDFTWLESLDPRKAKHFKGKQQVGISALTAVSTYNGPPRGDTSFSYNKGKFGGYSEDQQREIWNFVLGEKFNRDVRPDLCALLLATGADTELVELGRGATNGGVMQKNGKMSKKTFWAGCMKLDKDGKVELHGANFMGRMIMEIRLAMAAVAAVVAEAVLDEAALDVAAVDDDDKPLDLTEYVKRRDAKRKAYEDEDNEPLYIKRYHI